MPGLTTCLGRVKSGVLSACTFLATLAIVVATDQHSTNMSAEYWRAFPKVELHMHLEGAVRFSTVIEEYRRHGLPLPSEDETELRRYFLLEKPEKDLDGFLAKLDRTQKIFKDEATIERVAKECVIDRHAHGIRLLEIRYAPSYIADGHPHLAWDAIHSAIKRGVASALAEIGTSQIYVGLICIAVAASGKESFEKTTEFAIQHKDDFVGFDVAGAEQHLGEYKEYLDKIHEAKLPITIHAAEDSVTGKPENAVLAVEKLHARRIGHGIQILKSPSALELIRERKILLEIAPFSNWITGGVTDVAKHPVRQLYEQNVRVCINTDDPGIMNIDINDEYMMLHNTHSFTTQDFWQFNLWALEGSFLDESTKQEVKRRFFTEVFPTEAEWIKTRQAPLEDAE